MGEESKKKKQEGRNKGEREREVVVERRKRDEMERRILLFEQKRVPSFYMKKKVERGMG